VRGRRGAVNLYRLESERLRELLASEPVEKLWKSGLSPVENPVENENDAQGGAATLAT